VRCFISTSILRSFSSGGVFKGCAFLGLTAAYRVGVFAVGWRLEPSLDWRECMEVDYLSVAFLASEAFGVSIVTVA